MSSFVTIISKRLGYAEDPRISFRHWAVVISPTPKFQSAWILCEFTYVPPKGSPSGGPWATLRIMEQGQELDAYLKRFREQLPSRTTTLSIDQITKDARAIYAKYPKYNLFTNNCQHFAKRLVAAIAKSTFESPDDEIASDAPLGNTDVFKGTDDYLGELGLPDVEELLATWVVQAYDESGDVQADEDA